MANVIGVQVECKDAADARRTLDEQFAAVSPQDMFDDRQTKTRATLAARMAVRPAAR